MRGLFFSWLVLNPHPPLPLVIIEDSKFSGEVVWLNDTRAGGKPRETQVYLVVLPSHLLISEPPRASALAADKKKGVAGGGAAPFKLLLLEPWSKTIVNASPPSPRAGETATDHEPWLVLNQNHPAKALRTMYLAAADDEIRRRAVEACEHACNAAFAGGAAGSRTSSIA